MLTWAISWLTAKRGAGEGIGIILLIAMICDTIIVINIASCFVK